LRVTDPSMKPGFAHFEYGNGYRLILSQALLYTIFFACCQLLLTVLSTLI
jgi:hypothetical protein